MSPTVAALEAEVLRLRADARAKWVNSLIASLDADPEVEEAWASEVERRHVEIERGDVTLRAGPETLARLRSELQ